LVVLAAAAAGVPAIDGPSSTNDAAAIEREAVAAHRDGFRGKIATRLEHVAIFNRVFGQPAGFQ
jgi:citrate lyase beta subunit